MAKHAEDVTLKFGTKTMAKAQSMTWNEVGNTVETTGLGEKWKDYEIADLEWSMDTDQLWMPNDNAYKALRTAFLAKGKITVEWTDDDGAGRSGSAVITALGQSVRIGEALMTNISLVGSSALAADPAAPGVS